MARTIKKVLVWSVSAVVLGLTLAPQLFSQSAQSTLGTITGRVVDGSSKEAIAGATIAITRTVSRSEQQAVLGRPVARPVVISAADGSFVLEDVAPGAFSLRARKPGYSGGYFGQAKAVADETVQEFDLRSGEQVKGIVLRLWVASAITGRVISEAGAPLGGKWVQGLRLEALGQGPMQLRPQGFAVKTDQRGEYRISDLSPGRYLVQASSTEPPSQASELLAMMAPRSGPASMIDLSKAPVFHPMALSPAQASFVVVTAGEHPTNIDITIPDSPKGTSIRGRVIGLPAGFSACRVRLIADVLGSPLGEGFEVTATDTGPDGAFSFSNVAPGNYVVRGIAWGSDGINTLGRPSPSESAIIRGPLGPGVWFSRNLVVGDSVVRDFEIVAQIAARIVGTIVSNDDRTFSPEDLQGLAVSLIPATGWNLQGQPIVGIGDGGRFSSPGLPPGRVWLSLVGKFWPIAKVVAGGIDVRDAGLEVGSQDIPVTVFVQRREVTIDGAVVDGGGALRPDAYLVFFPFDRKGWNEWTIRRARPSRFGRFTLQVAPGEYLVAAVEGGLPDNWRSLEYVSRLAPGALRVQVENKPVLSQQVRLQRSGG